LASRFHETGCPTGGRTNEKCLCPAGMRTVEVLVLPSSEALPRRPDVTGRTGLGQATSAALVPWSKPRAVHDPGKALLDAAIAVARAATV